NSFKGILKGFNTMGATLILQKVFKDFSRCFKRLFKGVIDCTQSCIFLTKLNQRVFWNIKSKSFSFLRRGRVLFSPS
ncbi:hypothetical protein, partial [Helicobacter sp. 12S02634-8]|uniref:hypothetical protein n=1 Tax=Helicobacter sp. 12S02634-8 TaxID=1476199 RepID=UPI001C0ED4AA